VAIPYPTGTCTLQDAPSFAWRANAMLISSQGNAEYPPAKAAPPWLSNAAKCWV